MRDVLEKDIPITTRLQGTKKVGVGGGGKNPRRESLRAFNVSVTLVVYTTDYFWYSW